MIPHLWNLDQYLNSYELFKFVLFPKRRKPTVARPVLSPVEPVGRPAMGQRRPVSSPAKAGFTAGQGTEASGPQAGSAGAVAG